VKIFVGMTGASGAVYGLTLIKKLNEIDDIQLHLSITPDAIKNINLETDISMSESCELIEKLRLNPDKTFIYDYRDFTASPSSGSFKIDKYIFCASYNGLCGQNCFRCKLKSLRKGS